DRRAFRLLSGSGPKECANDSLASRIAIFVPDVRASLRAARRSLSSCRSGLSRLRTQRLAGPEEIPIYVRSHCRDHESLYRGTWTLALRALHAGLRGSCWFSHGTCASGARGSSHRSRRCRTQRRAGRELEDAARVLERSRGERKCASHKSPVATDDADAPCRERSERRSLRS